MLIYVHYGFRSLGLLQNMFIYRESALCACKELAQSREEKRAIERENAKLVASLKKVSFKFVAAMPVMSSFNSIDQQVDQCFCSKTVRLLFRKKPPEFYALQVLLLFFFYVFCIVFRTL